MGSLPLCPSACPRSVRPRPPSPHKVVLALVAPPELRELALNVHQATPRDLIRVPGIVAEREDEQRDVEEVGFVRVLGACLIGRGRR